MDRPAGEGKYDQISHTYFARAREYKPELGRFAGQDIIKGFVIAQELFPTVFQGKCIGGMCLLDIQKKFVPDQTYTIYVSNKKPGYFVIYRKVPIGCIFGILMGIWFIYMGYVSFT